MAVNLATSERARPSPPLQRPGLAFKTVLALFVGSMLFSIGGMLLLKAVPSAMGLFGPALPLLIKTPTWVYMALLPVLPVLMYVNLLGPARMAFFVFWGCLVGGASELIGTAGLIEVQGVALPFGRYAYTDLLGPKILGHVPFFIPLSWFAMSILSLDLAQRVAASRLGRILLGTAFMVLWDVALDPAMQVGTVLSPVFWYYPDGGFFFGMPLSNWFGWAVVTLLIMSGYEWIGGGLPASRPWAPWLYLLNGLFPLLISLIMGLFLAAVLGAFAVAFPLLVVWWYGTPTLKRPPL